MRIMQYYPLEFWKCQKAFFGGEKKKKRGKTTGGIFYPALLCTQYRAEKREVALRTLAK